MPIYFFSGPCPCRPFVLYPSILSSLLIRLFLPLLPFSPFFLPVIFYFSSFYSRTNQTTFHYFVHSDFQGTRKRACRSPTVTTMEKVCRHRTLTRHIIITREQLILVSDVFFCKTCYYNCNRNFSQTALISRRINFMIR